MGPLSSENPFDRLADDLLVGEILSRFDTDLKSIGRLSSVSKNLRRMGHYRPVIDFDGEITDRIANYLDEFFAFRMNSNIKPEFRRFRFCMPDAPTWRRVFNQHLLSWLHAALYLNVQELILQVREHATPYHHCYDVPSLKLHSYPSKHLRALTLENIHVGLDENFEAWVSTYCVSLEELRLKGVVFPSELRITSSSLRVFTIDAHFKHFCVSAPKLVTLHVTWNLLRFARRDASLRVSSAPNLEDFVLKNQNPPADSVDFLSSGDERNFPSLQSGSLKFFGMANFPLDSLRKLLLDVSQTKILHVTDTILRKIANNGLIDLATSFNKLEELDVTLEVSDDYPWRWRQERQEWPTYKIIMSFVRRVRPSLKTFTLAIDDQGVRDKAGRNQNSRRFRKLLATRRLSFGISPSAFNLNDKEVKVELSYGEEVTLLVKYIIEKAPIDMKFIFSYSHPF